MEPMTRIPKEERKMKRTIVTTIAVVAGLAAVSSVGLTSVTSAARQPGAERAPVAAAKDGAAARARAWTFEGKADLNDSGALELNIRSTDGVPRAFDMVRRLLVGRDVLLVNTRVAIVDRSGRAVALSRLNDAILRAKGMLLPAAQWRYDLDKEATPVVRVNRIIVLGLDVD
jgi:hypothetical protein